VASGAFSLVVEKDLSIFRGCTVEGAFRRLWARQGKLAEVEGRKLGADPVHLVLLLALLRPGGNRILFGVVQTRIVKHPFSMHFEIADIRIPIPYSAGAAEGAKTSMLIPSRLSAIVSKVLLPRKGRGHRRTVRHRKKDAERAPCGV